ncbi:hypothetical protein LEN26_012282 [Aphanomyces euteiches]|nr:hypothetical protein LEN26_012282 [Aphanomyces euteiches]
MSSDSRNNDLAIKKYINTTVKPLMRYPTPLQADVWWRILFRMLPVNSRFFFLQDTNPSIIECSFPGCSAVETMQHILFDCKFVKPVWNWHQAAWRPFGIPFTWNTIINLDEFAVSEEWVPHFSVIRRLWVLLVSTLLRDFWIHRNRTKFEGKPVPYIQAVKEVSLVSWTASIRRDPTIDSDEAMQIDEDLVAQIAFGDEGFYVEGIEDLRMHDGEWRRREHFPLLLRVAARDRTHSQLVRSDRERQPTKGARSRARCLRDSRQTQVSYQLHLVLAEELASDTCVKKSQDSKTMHELNRTQATIQVAFE